MKNILILILMVIVLHVSATTYQIGSDATYHQYSELPELSSGDIVNFKRGETFNGGFTSIAGITIGAYGTGANPIITGFTTVTEWTNLGSNIWESTSAVSSLATCNMVSIGGVNTPVGRYPNYTNTPHSNSEWISYNKRVVSNQIVCPSLTGTPDFTGAEIAVKTSLYVMNRGNITAQSGSTLTFAMSVWLPRDDVDGWGLIIQNHPATLDQQNEWYYNASTHKIQVYSTSQPTNVKVASVENIITLNGSNVSINNLDLHGANTTAIYSIDEQVNKTVSGCDIKYCGNTGINLKGYYAKIENCIIKDCNNCAINLNSSQRYCMISGNTISDIAIIPGMGQGGGYNGIIISGMSHSCTIQNNSFNNVGFNTMSIMGDSLVVKNNYLNNSCIILDDGGSIYFNSTGLTASNDINYATGNIILNSGTNGTANNGTPSYNAAYLIHSGGIYVDIQPANYSFTYNTIYKGEFGIQTSLNEVTNINIQYNTIYDTESYALYLGSNASSTDLTNNTAKNNILVQPDLGPLLEIYWGSPTDVSINIADMDNNIYARPLYDNTTQLDTKKQFYSWSLAGKNYRSFEEWKSFAATFGKEIHSTKSPVIVQSADSIRFVYNATDHDSIVTLIYPSIDMSLNLHATKDTLLAMSSRIYLPYMNQDVPVNPVDPIYPDQTGQINRWKNMYFRNHKN